MGKNYCSNCGDPRREGSKFCPSCGMEFKGNLIRPEESLIASAGSSSRKQMSGRAKLVYSSVGLAVLVGFFFIFATHITEQPHPIIEKQQTIAMGTLYTGQQITQHPAQARVEDGKITIALSLLLEKKMLEFDYNSSTTVVPLLAYISNEGKLVTSIRFCEPCNSKSFEIDGKDLVCGNCGTRWNLNNLRGISGNCQKYPPAPIPSEITGREIQIDEKLVANWKLRI